MCLFTPVSRALLSAELVCVFVLRLCTPAALRVLQLYLLCVHVFTVCILFLLAAHTHLYDVSALSTRLM